jgi:broad specificity phosphatase PhoE/ribonuclease HI
VNDHIRAVVIEADGGSRGNPGPAAYGAVLRTPDGQVLAEDAQTIGRASNNVAEYRGLIAGLQLAAEFAPEAEIEVRMDSKLVVEQMSGNWKIKHPDMKPLAMEANRLAPFGTTYHWVPRAENKHADRLANEALDGVRSGVTVGGSEDQTLPEDPLVEAVEADEDAREVDRGAAGYRGWAAPSGPPTTLILVRHGVTELTSGKRFSGGLRSSNPGLSDEGRDQMRAVAEWLAPVAEHAEALVASPVRRTRESAEILAERLGLGVEEEPGLAEMEFGSWDGKSFLEVAEQEQAALDEWIGSVDVRPGGDGESFRDVESRVLEGLQRILDRHAGKTVVVVSHVTPIKTLVAQALQAPLLSVFRMELAPASVSVLAFFEDGRASMRSYNAQVPGADAFAGPHRW